MPQIALTLPAIAQRHGADWGLIRPEQVDVIRHEPFDYEFKGPRHLLIASERAERDDGETLLDGLPRSNRREWNHKMTFVPAGRRFYGWQKPHILTRVTYILIDPSGPLLDPELRFAETEFKAFQAPCVKGIRVPGAGTTPRNRLDALTDMAKRWGAKGLVWVRVDDDEWESMRGHPAAGCLARSS